MARWPYGFAPLRRTPRQSDPVAHFTWRSLYLGKEILVLITTEQMLVAGTESVLRTTEQRRKEVSCLPAWFAKKL